MSGSGGTLHPNPTPRHRASYQSAEKRPPSQDTKYQAPGARYLGPDIPDPAPFLHRESGQGRRTPFPSLRRVPRVSLPDHCLLAVLPYCPTARLPSYPNHHRAVQTPSPADYITPRPAKDQVPPVMAHTGPPDTLRHPLATHPAHLTDPPPHRQVGPSCESRRHFRLPPGPQLGPRRYRVPGP